MRYEITLHPSLAALLQKLRRDLIVIGSVARGNKPPGDLDLWINCDGYAGSTERYQKQRAIIAASGLQFESVYPMHWGFYRDQYPPPMAVELIGTPTIGISFNALRHRSEEQNVGGVMLRVAPPQWAGTATKGT